MGEESSHRTEELSNLVLQARHLSGSAFCWIDMGLPEQAVEGFPLGLWKMNLLNFHGLIITAVQCVTCYPVDNEIFIPSRMKWCT